MRPASDVFQGDLNEYESIGRLMNIVEPRKFTGTHENRADRCHSHNDIHCVGTSASR